MHFSKNKVTVGSEPISSARESEQGMRIIVHNKGALVVRTIEKGSKQPLFSKSKIISYADECAELSSGRIEYQGGIRYVPN